MRIKICGMRRPEDIAYANQTRPDYVGFIMTPGYRRSVTPRQVRELTSELAPEIQTVGVFVDAPPEEIIALLEEGVIHMAQLHGNESEEDIVYIKATTGKPVIKAVKATDRYVVEAWLDTAADYLLFDSGTGTGKSFDWSILEDVPRDFFLAGGLDEEGISRAYEMLHPFAVDISSGVETEGVKDLRKMAAAVSAARRMQD